MQPYLRYWKMAEESVYKYIELTGVSGKSWEQAINNAITKAATSLRDLRVAEVITQDVRIEGNKIAEYRVRLKLSFKYEKE
jgi:flavin-binding protein dodecin